MGCKYQQEFWPQLPYRYNTDSGGQARTLMIEDSHCMLVHQSLVEGRNLTRVFWRTLQGILGIVGNKNADVEVDEAG